MNKNGVCRFVSLIICIGIIFGSLSVYALADNAGEIAVFTDGTRIGFDVNPIIENGRTLVPMRAIFEALDAKVDWIADTQTAVAYKDGIKIEITVDKKEMIKNGEVIVLDVPARLVGGRTLVPVRAVSEGMGANVEWNSERYEVVITSGVKEPAHLGGNKYHYTQLSSEDQKYLYSAYGEIRNEMEQKAIAQLVLSYPKTTAEYLKSQNTAFADAICNEWNRALVGSVMQIQADSESEYDVVINDANEIKKGYESLLKEYGYHAAQVFEFSFDSTPGGKKVMFVEFKDVVKDETNPQLVTSKYAAVVSDNGTVKYYTLEFNPLSGGYMLCEIKLDSRESYGESGDTKNDFLAGIDRVF